MCEYNGAVFSAKKILLSDRRMRFSSCERLIANDWVVQSILYTLQWTQWKLEEAHNSGREFPNWIVVAQFFYPVWFLRVCVQTTDHSESTLYIFFEYTYKEMKREDSVCVLPFLSYTMWMLRLGCDDVCAHFVRSVEQLFFFAKALCSPAPALPAIPFAGVGAVYIPASV